MKRMLIPALLVLVLLADGCGGKREEAKPGYDPAGDDVILICTTFLPVYCFTEQIAGGLEGFQVEILADIPVFIPEKYTLGEDKLELLPRADVIVRHGLRIDRFLDEAVLDSAGVSGKTRLITLTDAFPAAMLTPQLSSRRIVREPVAPESPEWRTIDPHVWVSPRMAARQVRYLAARLAEFYPEHRDSLLARGRRYAGKLDSLGNAFREMVTASDNNRVVVNRDFLYWFARDTGLSAEKKVERSDGIEVGPREIHLLTLELEKTTHAAILVEPGADAQRAKHVAEETGTPLCRFDPVINGPIKPGRYLYAMQQNLEQFRKIFAGEDRR